MIFTPCFEGISHNVNEAIELTRSVPGANLLLNAPSREPIARRQRESCSSGLGAFTCACGVPPAHDREWAGRPRSK